MMLQIEIYDPERHYQIAAGWWRGHSFPVLPVELLPKLGVFVYDQETPLACCWVYLDNSTPLAKLEWCTTNPDAGGLQCMRALNVALTFLKQHVRDLGYSYLITTARHHGLVKTLERNGFVTTDRDMVHLGLILDERIQAKFLEATGRGDPVHSDTILASGDL